MYLPVKSGGRVRKASLRKVYDLCNPAEEILNMNPTTKDNAREVHYVRRFHIRESSGILQPK